MRVLLLRQEKDFFIENVDQGGSEDPFLIQLVAILRSIRDNHWHYLIRGLCETLLDELTELIIMYLTYLQENFKPVVYRSASVEVFDEEDAQVVHPEPSYWGCQGT